MDGLISALGLDPARGLTAIGAGQMAAAYHPQLNPDLGVLLLELDSPEDVERASRMLQGIYPANHSVLLVRDLDTPVEESTFDQLDPEVDAMALYIPPLEVLSSFESFQDTVAHLRAPDGCPWDREQTHQSLRKHMLEEAYETLEAIDRGDLDALREELGDLMLQILMHAQIAHEEGLFKMSDVVADIQAKLIRRHPHVFGDVEVADVDEVLHNWEHLKQREKATGPLDGVPRTLPALAQAAELQDRAGRVGFRWPSILEALAKMKEELDELVAEVDPDLQATELGDLLFAIVNYARWIKSDPEAELQRASQRFRARFSKMLEAVADQGRTLEELDIGEMMNVWDDTKGTSA
jgi:tetrapyrrole methylase family protein/MazG family protein